MNEKIRKTILYFLNNAGKHAGYNEIWNYVNSKIEDVDESEFNSELADLTKKHHVVSYVSINKEKRYEAEVRRHYHFICEQCGEVRDIFLETGAVNMISNYAQKIAHSFARIDKVNMSFQGVCHECKKNSN